MNTLKLLLISHLTNRIICTESIGDYGLAMFSDDGEIEWTVGPVKEDEYSEESSILSSHDTQPDKFHDSLLDVREDTGTTNPIETTEGKEGVEDLQADSKKPTVMARLCDAFRWVPLPHRCRNSGTD